MFADNYACSEKAGFLVIELDRHLLLPVIVNPQHLVGYIHFSFTRSNEWNWKTWQLSNDESRGYTSQFEKIVLKLQTSVSLCLLVKLFLSPFKIYWNVALCSAVLHAAKIIPFTEAVVFMLVISINCITSYWNLHKDGWEQCILSKDTWYLSST